MPMSKLTDMLGDSRIHDFTVTRFASLQINVDRERLKHEQVFAMHWVEENKTWQYV